MTYGKENDDKMKMPPNLESERTPFLRVTAKGKLFPYVVHHPSGRVANGLIGCDEKESRDQE